MNRVFQWVRIGELNDWLSCGWIVSKPNAPMHHHEYSFLCEWLCNCKIKRPGVILRKVNAPGRVEVV